MPRFAGALAAISGIKTRAQLDDKEAETPAACLKRLFYDASTVYTHPNVADSTGGIDISDLNVNDKGLFACKDLRDDANFMSRISDLKGMMTEFLQKYHTKTGENNPDKPISDYLPHPDGTKYEPTFEKGEMHPRPWGKRTHKFEKAIKYCWLVLKDHPDVLTFVDRTHSEQEESGVTKKSEGPPTVNPRPRSGSLSGEDLSSAMGVSSKADDQLAAAASRQAAADEQNAAAQESKANAAHAQVLWSQYHLLNKSADNLETVLDIGRQIRALQGVTIRELSEHEGQKRERKAKRKAEKAKRKAAKKAKKAAAAAAAAEAEKAAREAAAAPQREEEGGAAEAARSSEEAAGEDTHVE